MSVHILNKGRPQSVAAPGLNAGRPWWLVGRRGLGGNPFESLGLDWCRTCQCEMDTDTQATHRNGLYVYKRTCRRCGTVVKYGAYQAPLVSDTPIPAVALDWTTRPEQDRR